jgi:hypothetical protein
MKSTIKNAIKESQLDDEGSGNTTYLDYDEAIAELAYYKAESRVLKRDMMLSIG